MKELIVDVRSHEEFLKNHVKGAINVPLHDMELYEGFLKNICQERFVALYCGSEHRARIAKKKLDKLEIEPKKYIILTYWKSKEIHDESHLKEDFLRAFQEMPVHLVKMPYEEFYEILR